MRKNRRSGVKERRGNHLQPRAWRRMRQLMAACSTLLLVLSFVPALTAGAAAPAAAGQAQTAAQNGNPGQASIDLRLLGCDPTTDDAATVSQRSYDDLVAACTKPVSEVTVHLTATATGADSPQTSGSPGQISFSDLAAGTYTAYSDIPRGTAYEIVYCSADGGAPYQKSFNDAIVTTFADLQTEQIVCSWFVVPVAAGQASSPTPSPTATASPTASSNEAVTATAPASDLASLQVNVLTCPDGTDLTSGSSYTDLSQNCIDPAANVTLHLSNVDRGSDTPQTTGNDGRATWTDLQPGTYTAYSDSDRAASTEVLYCAADGDVPYQKPFNDAIVTTFENVTTEQLVCSWFEIPAAIAPAETPSPVATASPTATVQPTETVQAAAGASLTVHLASCPVGYTGTDFYADCHGNGIADMEFVLSGPDGDLQQTTTIPETPGPGVVDFTGLTAGEYTLAGGPPGDFGKVQLYCSLQPGGDRIDAPVDSTQASLSIGESDTVLCDWYYIPEDQSGTTPTPSPTVSPTLTPTTVVPTATATATPTQGPRAEILVTLRSCPPLASGYGGASQEQLQQSCTQPVNDVPFSLGDVQAPPLSANTGVSGEGAVRFYDLLPANYTLTPTLPGNLTSLAVFCTVDSGAPYQKALQNGAVTFVDVKTDSITCNWYAVQAAAPTATVVPGLTPTVAPGVTPTAAPTQPSGPSGSITVREYLCAKDKASIKDWERECKAGSSGAAFTLKSSDGNVEEHGSTDKAGVLVFKGLADGHYALNQDKGSWCRATADRVDSQSRVIVGDGGNTDVVLYQCNQVTSLPDTGTGTPISRNDGNGSYSTMLLIAIGLAMLAGGISLVTFVHSRRSQRHESEQREMAARPVATDSGRTRMRFK